MTIARSWFMGVFYAQSNFTGERPWPHRSPNLQDLSHSVKSGARPPNGFPASGAIALFKPEGGTFSYNQKILHPQKRFPLSKQWCMMYKKGGVYHA